MQGVVQESCGCNPEILFGKLRYAKRLTWPPEEVEAVKSYLRAFWRTAPLLRGLFNQQLKKIHL